jgi:hypothetical protein
MNAPRARHVSVTRKAGDTSLLLNIELTRGTVVMFPLSKIRGFTPAKIRARGSEVFDVRVEDRGWSICWPTLEIDFNVPEVVAEVVGIGEPEVAKRSGGRSRKKSA